MSTEHSEHTSLEYVFPDLGEVQVRLFAESAQVLDLLNTHKAGVEFFERLNQLGALRSVFKTAHHPRWEYMVLQMWIAQQLKTRSVFAMAAGVRLPGRGTVSSVEELLKCWVLLSNAGHIEDTLEAERLWLSLCKENKTLRNVFLQCMPSDSIRIKAEAMLAREDIAAFHHYIAMFFLQTVKEKDPAVADLADRAVSILEGLLVDTVSGSQLDRCQLIFSRIRRTSYVLLDLNRSASFLRLDPHHVIGALEQHVEEDLFNEDSDFLNSLEYAEHLLFSRIYASRESSFFKQQYFEGQRERMATVMKRHGTNDHYWADKDSLRRTLSQARRNNFGAWTAPSGLRPRCRISLLSSTLFSREECKYWSEEVRLRLETPDAFTFLVTPTPSAFEASGSILDVFDRRTVNERELASLYGALFSYIRRSYQASTELWDDSFEQVAARPLRDLFGELLSRYIEPGLVWRFNDRFRAGDYDIVGIPQSEHLRRGVGIIRARATDSQLTASRRFELEKLTQVIRRRRDKTLLVSVTNLDIYGENGKRVAEWDGAWFEIDTESIRLFVLEAKRRVSEKSKAPTDDLRESLHGAGIWRVTTPLKVVHGKGYAYAGIGLTEHLQAFAAK